VARFRACARAAATIVTSAALIVSAHGTVEAPPRLSWLGVRPSGTHSPFPPCRADRCTVSWHGGREFRFVAAVERGERDPARVPLETQRAPFRAFVQGRSELDRRDRDAIRRARHVMASLMPANWNPSSRAILIPSADWNT